jgi:uncharacterized DUF497 family protein
MDLYISIWQKYVVEFEWDLSKEIENLTKHGVAFAEAVETFSDPDGFQFTDKKHSAIEERFFWVGKSASGRILTTRFTRRGDNSRIFRIGIMAKIREVLQ